MAALPKVIYVMGPPGAGKGTQAEMLAQKLHYHRFSTGDAFRTVSRQDTELGRRVKETIDNGFLAPPEMAAEIVIAAISEHLEQGKGLIFDGTPRTVEEAQLVDEFFLQNNYGRPLAIVLNLDKEEMIRRNSKRRFCLDIQGDYPILNPEDEKKCLELGGRIGIRPDDEPEKFATRWQQFMDRTFPVIQEYRKQGITFEVDGMGSIEEVHAVIMAHVKTFSV
ncbi:MAG: nucleoside monophosphate kinase [Candidatus Andersenbacteria bacterium]